MKRFVERLRKAIFSAKTDDERKALMNVLEKVLEQLPELDDDFFRTLEQNLP